MDRPTVMRRGCSLPLDGETSRDSVGELYLDCWGVSPPDSESV